MDFIKKPIVAAAIIVSAIVILAAVVMVWVLLASRANAPEIVIEYTDMTASKKVDVKIENLSFSPPNIRIKKGTTVTWTNNDGVGHNVVADEAANSGGLPTERPVFGRNGTYSFTFKETGTIHYHCTPHTFMKGIIEVVE